MLTRILPIAVQCSANSRLASAYQLYTQPMQVFACPNGVTLRQFFAVCRLRARIGVSAFHDDHFIWSHLQHVTFLTEVWLPYALQDSMLFVSTMAFATVYLESAGSYSRSSKSVSYKNEAIRAINASLQCPGKAVSDSTIGAVAMLMKLQVSIDQWHLTF